MPVNRRRFLKYAGATAAVVGSSAFGLDYLATRPLIPGQQTLTTLNQTTSTSSVPMPPRITGLMYEPTRTLNSKTYDIRVDVGISNPAGRLFPIQVMLEPVVYTHLPAKAFPNEQPKTTTLQTTALEGELLSTYFTDLKGGREYDVKAILADGISMMDERTLRTEYVREFENIAALDDFTVVADYYTWYESAGHPYAAWKSANGGKLHVYDPLLGEYSSSDPIVISKHIDWATGYGIDAFAVSWWGENNTNPNILTTGSHPNDLPKLEGAFLPHPMLNQMKFFILYENNGRLKIQNPNDSSDKWIEDLDEPFNRDRLISDFLYLAKYFQHPSYLKVDGKPALIFDYTASFRGDVKGAFQQARDAIRANGGPEVYLINDLAERAYHPEEIINASHPYIEQIVESTDAFGYGSPYCYLCYDLEEPFKLWHEAAIKHGKGYVPYSTPGFEPSPNVLPNAQPVRRDPETSRKLFSLSLKHSTDKVAGISAFNDWYWGHQIEPAIEYGFTYLQTIRDSLAGH